MPHPLFHALRSLMLATALAASLLACGGGGGSDSGTGASVPAPPPAGSVPTPAPPAPGSTPPPTPAPAPVAVPPTATDAARFLTQATFGIQSEAQIEALRAQGFDAWLNAQTALSAKSHLQYIKSQASRNMDGKPSEEMSYEAVWQQWLTEPGQLRARMSWALLQIMVISNIAPDVQAEGMSSYMDMLNANAFSNYRDLLEQVTLHPAMGYYLSMLQSEKEDPATGSTPNENYAREVLQLFSIGLVKLNVDGTPQRDAAGKTMPTFGEVEVRGFAKAFSGWSYASGNIAKEDDFFNSEEDWVNPLKAWPTLHSKAEKTLLNGVKIAANGTPEADMKAALDNIFNHPNVGPFISMRLIQRLVTSNPSAAYVQRVASVFNNNGAGTRGDLKAVVRAILLDVEARDAAATSNLKFGKQREPVIRFANFLRATGAKSASGFNRIHYLDSADSGLNQSPLLAPSVFNFYSPSYVPPGIVARAGLVAPEFQITSEISVVGSLNFFARLVNDGKYGDDEHAQVMNTAALQAVAGDSEALLNKLNALLLNYNVSAKTRASIKKAIDGINAADKEKRVKAALLLVSFSPDFAIQR